MAGDGCWRPLPSGTWHGTVICPFVPSALLSAAAASAASSGPGSSGGLQSAGADVPSITVGNVVNNVTVAEIIEYMAPLQLGDSVQLLEEYIVDSSPISAKTLGGSVTDALNSLNSNNTTSSSTNNASSTSTSSSSKSRKTKWYRGYVFQASAPDAPPRMGVFPGTHVYCRALLAHQAEEAKLKALNPGIETFGSGSNGDDELLLEIPGLEAGGLSRNNTMVPIGRANTVVAPKDRSNHEDSSDAQSPSKRSKPSRPTSGSGLVLKSSDISAHPPIPTPINPSHETLAGAREPLADEIAAALREWGILLKRHLANQDYPLFATMKDLFHQLYQGRRQLLSQTLSQEELVKLRRTLVSKLDLGNKIQGLDLIVRHTDKGYLIGERSSSVVKVFRQHLELAGKWTATPAMVATRQQMTMSQGVAFGPGLTAVAGIGIGGVNSANLTFMSGQSSTSMLKDRSEIVEAVRAFTLALELTACTASICLPGEHAELSFFLYNRQEAKQLTEEFVVIIDYNGNPRGTEVGQMSIGTAPAPIMSPDITPRLGFPDAIHPGHARNTVYVTLASGEFSGRTTALSARNVQVCVQVRLSDGTFVENCISKGLGVSESNYESIVYYHSNSPRWNEILRVDLEPQLLEQAHLFFTFRHCSSTDKNDRSFFAFAFLPLLRSDATVINDAAHTLTLYRYDRRLAQPSVYLTYQAGPNIASVPIPASAGADALTAAAEAMSKAPQLKDTFVLRTMLCSTLMTQSVAILNLLHWHHISVHFRVPLESMLRDFHLVPELEIVKFLHGILDAFFDMMDNAGANSGGKLDDVIFNCLVFVLGIVIDRRFTAYGSIVDAYVEKWFKSKSCWKNLLGSFMRLLQDPVKRELRDAVKVWGYWIRFIVRSGLADQPLSRQSTTTSGSASSPRNSDNAFTAGLANMLSAIEGIMSMTLPEAIGTQTLALQHFPQLLPDLARVYGPAELVMVVVRFADSVRGSKARLNAHKLAFIFTLIRGPLFADRRSRLGLVTAVTRWISECLGGEWDRERDDTVMSPVLSGSGPMPPPKGFHHSMISEKENLRLCLNVTADLVDRLQKVGDRLERGRHDDGGGGGGNGKGGRDRDLGDPALREEDYRKCILMVSDLLPKLLETYSDLVDPYDTGNVGDQETLRFSSLSGVASGSGSGTNFDNINSPVAGSTCGGSVTNPPSVLMSASVAPSPLSPNPASVISPLGNVPTSNELQLSANYLPRMIEAAELGATVIALLNLLPESTLQSIFSRPTTMNTLIGADYSGSQVITFLFVTLQSLMRGDAFPSNWVSAHILVNKISVKALRAVSEILKSDKLHDMFAEEEATAGWTSTMRRESVPMTMSSGGSATGGSGGGGQPKKLQLLWADFFRVLLQLLNSRWVAVESFAPQRARVAHRLGADVRGEAGELLRSMWEYLTEGEKTGRGVQMAFIPNLFGPFLELTMSPHPKLKVAAVELLFSTIERNYRAHGDFSRIEVECVDRLDRLVMVDGNGDDAYRRFFIEALGKQFTNAARGTIAAVTGAQISSTASGGDMTPVTSAGAVASTRPSTSGGGSVAIVTSFAAFGARFLSLLDSFLELCITLRDSPAGESFDDERIWTTLRLIRFLRESGRKGLYVKYVHKLADLHKKAENAAEAALTLKLHADLLPWSHLAEVDAVPEYGFPKYQTCFQRKEEIYMECIKLLEKANHWERAMIMASEMAGQYQKKWHDYGSFSNMLRLQARLADNIMEKERYYPSYYRVGFYGKGFPLYLRGKQFIYRAGEWEKLGPFCERILNKYVGAQLLRTNATPSEEVANGPGSWIQITAVNPEIDVKRWGSAEMDGIWVRWEPSYDAGGEPIPMTPLAGLMASAGAANATKRSSNSLGAELQSVGSGFFVENVPLNIIVEPELDPDQDGPYARALGLMDRIPEPVKNYYTSNEINVFSFSRPFKRAPNPPVAKEDPAREFLELWTEKTVLVTADSFPCLARRSEVVKTIVLELSPIENAVIAVRTKNRQLRGLERTFETVALGVLEDSSISSGGKRLSAPGSGSKSINLFTMALNGAVDAPVNGGIPMYRRAFLSETFRKANPQFSGMVEMLERAIDEQVDILNRCLAIHEVIVPSQMRPLHETLVNFYLKNYSSDIARLGIKRMTPIHLRTSSIRPSTIRPRSNSNPGILDLNVSHYSEAPSTPTQASTRGGLYSLFGASGGNMLSSLPSPATTVGASPMQRPSIAGSVVGTPVNTASSILSAAPSSVGRSNRAGSFSGVAGSAGGGRPRRDSSQGTLGANLMSALTSAVPFMTSAASAVPASSSTGNLNTGAARSVTPAGEEDVNSKRLSAGSLRSIGSAGSVSGNGQGDSAKAGFSKLFEKW
ncbi:hypothetical protein HDU76_001989 [Blyttiomyces sp. JEL0837]|nr:hypothetical protein HDU76_001989 [Blyttiomyces sp. JEL0837]